MNHIGWSLDRGVSVHIVSKDERVTRFCWKQRLHADLDQVVNRNQQFKILKYDERVSVDPVHTDVCHLGHSGTDGRRWHNLCNCYSRNVLLLICTVLDELIDLISILDPGNFWYIVKHCTNCTDSANWFTSRCFCEPIDSARIEWTGMIMNQMYIVQILYKLYVRVVPIVSLLSTDSHSAEWSSFLAQCTFKNCHSVIWC